MKNFGFRFTVGSDPDHEDLVGDLYFNDRIVCVLTQEGGFESMQVEFYPAPGEGSWTFALADFEQAFAALKERMRQLRKTSQAEGR